MRPVFPAIATLALCASMGAAGCSTHPAPISTASSAPSAVVAGETPLPVESSAPGDIPDTQAFVIARTASYRVDTPEGWTRTTRGAAVDFTDKFNGLSVVVKSSTAAPQADPHDPLVLASLRGERAVEDVRAKAETLPAGGVVALRYTSNSERNAVTGKRIRLENLAYLFYKNGAIATLHLWAPLGADNVDQWRRIARSFRWR